MAITCSSTKNPTTRLTSTKIHVASSFKLVHVHVHVDGLLPIQWPPFVVIDMKLPESHLLSTLIDAFVESVINLCS